MPKSLSSLAPNIKKCIEFFNNITLWVAGMVLSQVCEGVDWALRTFLEIPAQLSRVIFAQAALVQMMLSQDSLRIFPSSGKYATSKQHSRLPPPARAHTSKTHNAGG